MKVAALPGRCSHATTTDRDQIGPSGKTQPRDRLGRGMFRIIDRGDGFMSTTTTEPAAAGAAKIPRIGTIAFAGTIGTIIEWYDFLIYGTAAALVFNSQFFPNVDPAIGTLAALGTFAVGFLARPVGGAIFGHFGDRIGRKSMLMLTMVGMGLSTAAIGLLPTYDQAGIWAPVGLVLLRV